MKQLLLLATSFILISSSCKKNKSDNPINQLPPETQTGANTFGCLVDGKVFLPKDPETFDLYSLVNKGVVLWGSPDEVSYLELEVKSINGFKINIHMQNIQNQKTDVQKYKLSIMNKLPLLILCLINFISTAQTPLLQPNLTLIRLA